MQTTGVRASVRSERRGGPRCTRIERLAGRRSRHTPTPTHRLFPTHLTHQGHHKDFQPHSEHSLPVPHGLHSPSFRPGPQFLPQALPAATGPPCWLLTQQSTFPPQGLCPCCSLAGAVFPWLPCGSLSPHLSASLVLAVSSERPFRTTLFKISPVLTLCPLMPF